MGSAVGHIVSGVVGGGGGGVLGAIGGVAGTVFGGPIGGAIGSAVGNALQGAVGQGVKGALDNLHKEAGMPKFLAESLTKLVDQVVDGLKNKNVPADAQQHVQDKYGKDFENLANELIEKLSSAVKQAKAEGSGSGSDSWMVAIAKAMGKVMGEKAKTLVSLSDRMAANKPADTSPEAKQEAAAASQTMSTEFQATSQEFNLLQTTFSTSIKSIGEAMSSIARKQ